MRSSKVRVRESKQQRRLLQNILPNTAAEVLQKTKNNAGKCHVSQDKRNEMDHEGKVASQSTGRKTLHRLAEVLTVSLLQLEPLSGIDKGTVLTAKSKR